MHPGWPTYAKDCDPELKDCWSYHEEISLEDRILFKGQRLIVPKSERLVYPGHSTYRSLWTQQNNSKSKRKCILARHFKWHQDTCRNMHSLSRKFQVSTKRNTTAE